MIAALALTSAFVSAEAHKGFSLGLNAGYVQMDSKMSASTPNATTYITNNDQSGRGFLGGLNAGYFHAMNSLNVGFQLQANLSTAEGKSSMTAPTTFVYALKLSQKWEANGSVRLGVNMNGAVPYVRVGASISQFEAASSSAIVGFTSNTTKKQLVGVLGGAGVDVAVNDKMAVGADFRMTFYPGFDANQVASGATYKFNVKPTTMVGSVGVKYFF